MTGALFRRFALVLGAFAVTTFSTIAAIVGAAHFAAWVAGAQMGEAAATVAVVAAIFGFLAGGYAALEAAFASEDWTL